MISIDYDEKTKIQLVSYCKERGIRGYAANGTTKEKIIKLLKEYDLRATSKTIQYDKMKYHDLLALCRERKLRGIKTRKEDMIKLLNENNVKDNLYVYLKKNNANILTKIVENEEVLKTLLPGTNKYCTFRCDTIGCLHTFDAIPRNVYKNELPRKYCDSCTHKNRKVNNQNTILKCSGTLQDKFPFITDIWSNENKKGFSKFSPGSNEKVKLKCPNLSAKHPEYTITVHHIQEHSQYRCPKCITKTSNAEMRIYSELKYTFKDVRWQQKIEGREADITIEDLKLVIEVDGFPWHKDKLVKDVEKNIIFEKNGYSVLRIRDKRLEDISCSNIICDIVDLSLSSYNKIIEWIMTTHNCDIKQHYEWKNTSYYKEIQASKMSINYQESIEYLFPESKCLWDYEKNNPFIPSQFSQGSDMEIWLKCSNNHSWKRKLSHLFRTIKGEKHIMKCPECNKPKSNKRILQINGKIYKSILEFCRQHNIDRNVLYKKLKQNKVDITSIISIQHFIEDSLLK
jgi:very-short-patch-repair endonuclease